MPCRKIGIPEGFPAGAADVQYYHLTPVYGSGTIYIPVTSNVFMRAIITKEEALNLIASIPSIEENPDYSNDYKTLADHYQALLDTHDCYALVQLIKNIYCKNQELHRIIYVIKKSVYAIQNNRDIKSCTSGTNRKLVSLNMKTSLRPSMTNQICNIHSNQKSLGNNTIMKCDLHLTTICRL
jgi:hypothetical protein